MEERYIEATASSRLKLGALIFVAIGFTVAMEIWWRPFMSFVRSLPFCDSLPWTQAILVGFVGLFFIAGVFASRAAYLTLKSGQTPFPGAWVWTRTRVTTGWRARVNGYVSAVIAVACLLGPITAIYAGGFHSIFCVGASCGC